MTSALTHEGHIEQGSTHTYVDIAFKSYDEFREVRLEIKFVLP